MGFVQAGGKSGGTFIHIRGSEDTGVADVNLVAVSFCSKSGGLGIVVNPGEASGDEIAALSAGQLRSIPQSR